MYQQGNALDVERIVHIAAAQLILDCSAAATTHELQPTIT